MNVSQALQEYSQQLNSISQDARLDVEILLGEILAVSKAELIAYPERDLNRKQQKQLHHWIERRLQGEPVAYLVGHQPFWTLDLVVTSDTLIPRPETELIVEWVLQQNHSHEILQLVDLGVGCGAIALALAVERPLWQIDAVDSSGAALCVAAKNAERYNLSNVKFYKGSWFAPLPADKKYHFILSNPPYIHVDDTHLLQLQFEPQMALVAEQEGLGDLTQIIQQARAHLLPDGYLLVEHGHTQSAAVQNLMRAVGFSEIIALQDFSQHNRLVVGKNLL